jgi:hypothetical protein
MAGNLPLGRKLQERKTKLIGHSPLKYTNLPVMAGEEV